MAQIRVMVNTETGKIKIDASGKVEDLLVGHYTREDLLNEVNKNALVNTTAFSLIRLANQLKDSELSVFSELVEINQDIYLATIVDGSRLQLKDFIGEVFDSIIDTLKD